MALDAQIVLRRGERRAPMPLDDFYLDYMKNALEPGEFVQAIEVPLQPAGEPPPRCAPTRSASASTATSRRCAPASALAARWRRGARGAPGLRRHGGDRQARGGGRGRAASASRGRRRSVRRRPGRAGRGLQAADGHARQRRLPAARWRRTCCSGSGWKRAPTTPLAAEADQRLERDAACPSIRRLTEGALNMNKPIDARLLQSGRGLRRLPEQHRRAHRRRRRAGAAQRGARVGISRPHESAHLHVAGEAPYIDDIPELAGTLHCALGLSPVAHGRLTGAVARRDPRRCPAWWRC